MCDGKLFLSKYLSSSSTLILDKIGNEGVTKFTNLHALQSIKRENFSEEFCTLFNIPGQKYTIGKRFTRRQKKNEFIFCLYPEVVEGSHCEISVERDGSYWITPLEGNATSINGDEIYEKTQLNHGDYMSLGINCSVEDDMVSYIEIYNRKWGGVPIFLFEKSKTLKNSAVNSSRTGLVLQNSHPNNNNNNSESSIGHNRNIVYTILRYVPLQKLKTLRLVSSLWNSEASCHIKSRSIINFDFDSYRDAKESMRFFQYRHEMRTFSHPSWYIRLPLLANLKDPTVRNILSKFRHDFSVLLNPKKISHNVKSLRMNGAICSKQDLSLRTILLHGVAQTLEHLEMMGDWGCATLSFPHVNFTKLKSVTIAFEILQMDNDKHLANPVTQVNDQNKGWCAAFLKILGPTSIKSMGFATSKMLTLLFLDGLSKLVENNPSEFTNLREIMVLHSTPEVLRCCLILPQPLTKLELNWLYTQTSGDDNWMGVFQDFEQLIAKHSATLVHLRVILPMLLFPSEIQLPILPRLKHLTILCEGDSGRTLKDRYYKKTFCPRVYFRAEFYCKGGEDKCYDLYEKYLPSLQYLRLDIKHHFKIAYNREEEITKCQDLFETFLLQKERKIGTISTCRQLRELHVPYEELENILGITRSDLEIWRFPNICNTRRSS